VEQSSDEALMAMLQDGGQDAIGCLFRRHARAIHTVGKRVLRDAAEAEDLVQEVFLYVFRKRDLYDSSKGSARSWLIQIAYTQAFLRRRKLKSLGLYEALPEENCNSHASKIPYDHSVEALFGRNCWKAILDDLTGDQEQVLRLHFFEGYTFSEIAEKLGQTYANVRNHHYRGLEKLRRHLAERQLNRR
jgi:RNA polymerase sigma-70 factor (ECF subfamily)